MKKDKKQLDSLSKENTYASFVNCRNLTLRNLQNQLAQLKAHEEKEISAEKKHTATLAKDNEYGFEIISDRRLIFRHLVNQLAQLQRENRDHAGKYSHQESELKKAKKQNDALTKEKEYDSALTDFFLC